MRSATRFPNLGLALGLLAAVPAGAMPGGDGEPWTLRAEDRENARQSAENLIRTIKELLRTSTDPEVGRLFLADQTARYGEQLRDNRERLDKARSRYDAATGSLRGLDGMLDRAEAALDALEAGGEAKDAPKLGLADARALRDRLLARRAKIEMELDEAGGERWRTERQMAVEVQVLGALEALAGGGAPGAPAKGAAGPESKDGPAPAAAPRPGHPFFAWSRRHGPGNLVRFTPSGQAWAQMPERICRSADGWIHWMDPDHGLVGYLNPEGRHVIYKGLPSEGKELVIHDWAPSSKGVNLLASRGDNRFLTWLRPDSKAQSTMDLPPAAVGRPVAFASLGRGDQTRVMVFMPRQVLMWGPSSSAWAVFRNPDGKALQAGARVVVHPQHGMWMVDRQSGGLLNLRDLDSTAGTFSLAAVDGVAGAYDLALSTPGAGQPAYLYVTQPSRDRIARYSMTDGKGISIPLRPGTAPGAIVAAPGGIMLFAMADGIGRIDPDGDIARVPIRGGRVAPLDLFPGYETGRLFFTEQGKPFLNALVLGEPGRLEADESLLGNAQGPSLLPEAAGGEPGGGATGEAKDETKGKARIGAAGAGAGPRAKGAGGPGPVAGAGVKPEPEPEQEPEPVADGASTDSDDSWPDPEGAGAVAAAGARPAAETKVATGGRGGGWVPRLVNRRITDERLRHIRDEHTWSDTPRRTDDGQVKGQFLDRWLADSRVFTKRILFRAANSTLARDWYEGADDHVIECTLAHAVGRACRKGSETWEDTRRVRVVLRVRQDEGEEELVTAYPVPEPGA